MPTRPPPASRAASTTTSPRSDARVSAPPGTSSGSGSFAAATPVAGFGSSTTAGSGSGLGLRLRIGYGDEDPCLRGALALFECHAGFDELRLLVAQVDPLGLDVARPRGERLPALPVLRPHVLEQLPLRLDGREHLLEVAFAALQLSVAAVELGSWRTSSRARTSSSSSWATSARRNA